MDTLRREFRGRGIQLVIAEYTPEEVEVFQSRQLSGLHPDFARGPLQRQAGGAANGVVSLVGWPIGGVDYLPSEAHFVGVTWGESPNVSALASQVRRVTSLKARSGQRPPTQDNPLSSREKSLALFAERFEITRSQP